MKKKEESRVSPANKKGVAIPFPKGSPFNPEPRKGRQGIYRNVAVKIPGTASPMIVHVKEY